jgi:superfamily I DNA and/or RNA helicase
MHETICAFPSQMLYSGKLTSHKSVASHLLRDLPETQAKAIPEEDVNDILGMPLVFFDTAGCEYFERVEGDGEDGSRCNENEAVVVARWIEQLVRRFHFCARPEGLFDGVSGFLGADRGWPSALSNCYHHTVRIRTL